MPSDAEDMVIFEGWMKYHNKSYETQDEKLKRFKGFKVSLREAEEEFPQTKNPLWVHLSRFADLADQKFCMGCKPASSSDEDEKNGVCAWYVDEKYMIDEVEGMVFGDSEEEEEGTIGVKRKGKCCCDEKDTKGLDAPEDGSVTVKRQRPCLCITSPAADDEKEDVTVSVKLEPEDTKGLDAPEDGSVTVKRQRPCSCITSPAADDEKEDVTVPVKPQPER